jgi:membrane-bound lytic murein transglycosylase MltF
MKLNMKKYANLKQDDTLYGLLAAHKLSNTYIRIFDSEQENKIIIELCDNPKKWEDIKKAFPLGENFKSLSRLQMGVSKMVIKYLTPEQILSSMLSILKVEKLKFKITINDKISSDGYCIIEIISKQKEKLLGAIAKLINVSPQKKIEIIEKNLII